MKLLGFIYIGIIISFVSCTKSNSNTSSTNTGNNNSNKTLNANGNIRTLAVDASGNIYAGGDFKNDSSYKYVAKWNGNNWSELGNGSGVLNTTNYITKIIATPTIIVGGNGAFGRSGDYIAKWNGSSWSQIGNSSFHSSVITTDQSTNIYATGGDKNNSGFYYVAKWNGLNWTELGSNNNSLKANNHILTLTTDGNGNVYAAGDFMNSLGIQYVAKWDGTTWTNMGTGNNVFKNFGRITFLYTDKQNNVYAGVYGFGSVPSYLAKWNGSNWTRIGSITSTRYNGSYFQTITTDAVGNLYGAVRYTDESLGDNLWRVVKWDGTNWTELANGNNKLNANGSIFALATDAAGNVYAAGAFTNYPAGNRFVAKWDGNSWTELGK